MISSCFSISFVWTIGESNKRLLCNAQFVCNGSAQDMIIVERVASGSISLFCFNTKQESVHLSLAFIVK